MVFALELEIRSPDGRSVSFGHFVQSDILMSCRQGFRRGQLGDIACAAKCLQEYGKDFLCGDWHRFDEVEQAMRERIMRQREAWLKQTQEAQLRSVFEESDQAFRLKNYSAVISALSPFELQLPPIQRRKLEIAKARTGTSLT